VFKKIPVLTKIQHIEKPMSKTDNIGTTNEMLGNEVHANQKKEMANAGAAIIAISSLNSGGTGWGACNATARS
jgi:hypothetical protein